MYEFSTSGLLRRILRVLYWAAHLPLLFAVLWVIGLAFCQPLCALPIIPFAIIVIWRLRQWGIFHVRRWIAVFCLLEAAMFYCLPGPQNDRWQLSTARMPGISTKEDGVLHISNIRDFIYRTPNDFDVCYLEEDFDPKEIAGVYLAESLHDGGECDLMLSFAFRDGRYLVISPERRIPAGQAHNSIRDYYKNYGLIYIFGTEEDLFMVRTDIKKEYLLLYPLRANAEEARQMLLHCVRLAQETAQENTAYNPFRQRYANGLLGALRILSTNIPECAIHCRNVAEELYDHHLIDTKFRGEWSQIQQAFAAGYRIRPEMRDDYSDVIRKKLELPTRENKPERHRQEFIAGLSDKKPDTEHEIKQKTAPARLSAADIPELNERLANEHRHKPESTSFPEDEDDPFGRSPLDHTEQAPAEDEGDQRVFNFTDPARDKRAGAKQRRRTAADDIPEPDLRLEADARREEEEEEQREQEAQGAANTSREHTGFEKLFFDRRPDEEETNSDESTERHPLDPELKRRKKSPFDDEKPKKKSTEEEDPFAPKEPIRI